MGDINEHRNYNNGNNSYYHHWNNNDCCRICSFQRLGGIAMELTKIYCCACAKRLEPSEVLVDRKIYELFPGKTITIDRKYCEECAKKELGYKPKESEIKK